MSGAIYLLTELINDASLSKSSKKTKCFKIRLYIARSLQEWAFCFVLKRWLLGLGIVGRSAFIHRESF